MWPHCLSCHTSMRNVYREKTSYKNNKNSSSQRDKLLQVCVSNKIKGAQTWSEPICLCTQQSYNITTEGQPHTFCKQIWQQSRRWSTLSHNWASLMNPPAPAQSFQQEESHPNTCLRRRWLLLCMYLLFITSFRSLLWRLTETEHIFVDWRNQNKLLDLKTRSTTTKKEYKEDFTCFTDPTHNFNLRIVFSLERCHHHMQLMRENNLFFCFASFIMFQEAEFCLCHHTAAPLALFN